MMECPDFDRLVDLAIELGPDVEVEMHLRLCEECSADFEFIRLVRKACIWAKEEGLWDWIDPEGPPMAPDPDLVCWEGPPLIQIGSSPPSGTWQ